MADKKKGFDAVVVSTTEPNHVVVAMKAIEMGKNVFVQKPPPLSIKEAGSEVKLTIEVNRLAEELKIQGFIIRQQED